MPTRPPVLRGHGLAICDALTARLETQRAYEAGRRQAAPWRRLYATAAWERTRARQLAAEPLCEWCLKADPPRTVPADVVHHKTPHRGDPIAFFAGPFECLCKPCHDGEAQRHEHRQGGSKV